MATEKFDSLFESLLNELTPVSAGEESFGSSLEKNISEAPGNAYLIGDLATALGKTREEVVHMIAKPLYHEIFGETGVNPANTEEDYREAIVDALKTVVDKLAADNGIKVSGRADLKKFTARIVSNLADATKDFSEKVSEREIEVATAAAAEEDDSDEHAEGEASEGDEAAVDQKTDQETVQDVIQPIAYKAYNQYLIKSRDDIPSGTLTRELEPIYTRIEGMANEDVSGEDIETRLRKAGTEQGRIVRYIKDLIKAGVIEPSESAKNSDEVEALEGGDEDMGRVEQDTFDKLYKHAFRDAQNAGGAPAGRHGGDYED
jgi:hypothetical protein